MTKNQTPSMGDREYKKFTGNKGLSVINVDDVSQATILVNVNAESVTLPVGDAGSTFKVRVKYSPIRDSIGGNVGYYKSATDNDTSLVVNGGTTLTGSEKEFINYTDDDSIYNLLGNGDWTVDYVHGIIYGKKADSGVAITVDYIYSTQEVNVTVNTGDTSIGAVEIKDATTDNRAVVSSANTARTTGTNVLVVQGVGADGTVAPTGSAVSNAPFSKITDGTETLSIDASGFGQVNLSTDSVGLAKETTLSTLAGKDFATQTTLATLASKDFATQTTLATLASKDFATQTTLASINASVEQVIDDGTNSVKIKELSPVWSRYTDAESLVSAQALTNSYANVGAVIDMRGYNVLQVWLIADVNNSENVKMKSLGKTASDGTDLYDLDDYPEETLWTTGASDFKKSYTFKLNNSIPYIQLQAYAGTVGETAGTLTISITKSYIE